MSNFSDFPNVGDRSLLKERPIIRMENDLRRLNNTLNTLMVDTQKMKSDITEIKALLKARASPDQPPNISKGWWIY